MINNKEKFEREMELLELELKYAKLNSEEKEDVKKELEDIHQEYGRLIRNKEKTEIKRPNKYKRKMIDKKKKQKLKDVTWMYIKDDNGCLKRVYYSDRKKDAKKFSEKKIRNYKGTIQNGGCYRKLYPYWDDVI